VANCHKAHVAFKVFQQPFGWKEAHVPWKVFQQPFDWKEEGFEAQFTG
jgi:hypothetical protein